MASRPIGGNLITLLYMTQLAAISQDPWFSRVESPHTADQCAIDLDPMPGVKFSAVLDVARWVRDELEKLKVTGYAKTSGASGLHIFIPLREGTPYEAGQIFCQIVATVVAEKHPKVATVTRAVRARGQKVYVDYLQNIEGKSLACAYSARASDFAGASTPLTGRKSTKASIRATSRYARCPIGWRKSATSGRRFCEQKARICENPEIGDVASSVTYLTVKLGKRH